MPPAILAESVSESESGVGREGLVAAAVSAQIFFCIRDYGWVFLNLRLRLDCRGRGLRWFVRDCGWFVRDCGRTGLKLDPALGIPFAGRRHAARALMFCLRV